MFFNDFIKGIVSKPTGILSNKIVQRYKNLWSNLLTLAINIHVAIIISLNDRLRLINDAVHQRAIKFYLH
jgi:hypothetical protein